MFIIARIASYCFHSRFLSRADKQKTNPDTFSLSVNTTLMLIRPRFVRYNDSRIVEEASLASPKEPTGYHRWKSSVMYRLVWNLNVRVLSSDNLCLSPPPPGPRARFHLLMLHSLYIHRCAKLGASLELGVSSGNRVTRYAYLFQPG